jgi:hypothetical protein
MVRICGTMEFSESYYNEEIEKPAVEFLESLEAKKNEFEKKASELSPEPKVLYKNEINDKWYSVKQCFSMEVCELKRDEMTAANIKSIGEKALKGFQDFEFKAFKKYKKEKIKVQNSLDTVKSTIKDCILNCPEIFKEF